MYAQITVELQLNTWVLGDVDRSPSLLALLVQALLAVAQCSPSSCQAGTQPQWDSPCCPYWNLSCKMFALASPHLASQADSIQDPHCGCEEPSTWWCFPCCCTRMLILQHQGNSEITSGLLYVQLLLLESLKMFELFGEVAYLSRSLCIDYPLCDKLDALRAGSWCSYASEMSIANKSSLRGRFTSMRGEAVVFTA